MVVNKSKLYNGRNINPLEPHLVIQKGISKKGKGWKPTEMEYLFHLGRMWSQDK